jgi:hypothetical protein
MKIVRRVACAESSAQICDDFRGHQFGYLVQAEDAARYS